ncbi:MULTISPECIES: hypothetical protein [Paracoccus]|uniref:hypothetical protein n=1 Tax=Paracoccus TaxID=265 RepID=UPI0003B3763D|nr:MULTISPECIES: hypothetical protein [Paracoccus]
MDTGTREPKLATAEFSRDMVETMLAYFDAYADEGVLKVEVTSWGLWLPNKVTGGRQFLGLAKLPDCIKQ